MTQAVQEIPSQYVYVMLAAQGVEGHQATHKFVLKTLTKKGVGPDPKNQWSSITSNLAVSFWSAPCSSNEEAAPFIQAMRKNDGLIVCGYGLESSHAESATNVLHQLDVLLNPNEDSVPLMTRQRGTAREKLPGLLSRLRDSSREYVVGAALPKPPAALPSYCMTKTAAQNG